MYLTICGHIEGLLSARIKRRIEVARMMINGQEHRTFALDMNGVQSIHLYKPVFLTVMAILNDFDDKVDSLPLSRLLGIYALFFERPLRSILDAQLNRDLEAIADLRNLFAHGRNISSEFSGPGPFGEELMTSSSFQKPAERLIEVGILKSLAIKSKNHLEYEQVFYSDAVLLHFYDAAKKIEQTVNSTADFPPEEILGYYPPLPDLEASCVTD